MPEHRREDDLNYALLIYNDAEVNREPEDQRRIQAAVAELLARPNVTGWLQLPNVESATTVRHDHGRTLLTDGPFVESKDYLGGFITIAADDLDGALAFAAEIQELRGGVGAVEIRPVHAASGTGA